MPKQQTHAQPLVSEQATTIVNDESVKSPDKETPVQIQNALGPKIIRYEMYSRDNLGDKPLRDEDGMPVVYTEAAFAVAHLDTLPEADMTLPAPKVYFYRAVYPVDSTHAPCGSGNCRKREPHVHWFNGLRATLVTKEVEIKDGPEAGEIVERTFVNDSRADRAAMSIFRDIRNARLNATADSRQDFRSVQKDALLQMAAHHLKIGLPEINPIDVINEVHRAQKAS